MKINQHHTTFIIHNTTSSRWSVATGNGSNKGGYSSKWQQQHGQSNNGEQKKRILEKK